MLRRSARHSIQDAKKRVASSPSEGSASKRSRLVKAGSSPAIKNGPRKSRYFKSDTKNHDEEDDEGDDLANPVETSDDGEESSDYEDASATGCIPRSLPAPPDEDDFSDPQPKRRGKAASKGAIKKQPVGVKRGDELWREGVTTGLPPGTEVIIKKPKARAAGDIPYADDSIHPNTLLFLGDLKKNNDRGWFKLHDPDYRTSLGDWNSFVEVLTQKLCEIDETIPELPTKDITFRVHRDVRFSPDKTPYKPYFSAAWSRTGRKGPYAHYYVQVQPGGDGFVGGGLWHPEGSAIAALRRDIAQNPQRLKGVLMSEGIRKELLDGAPRELKKVVKAFVSSPSNKESALKTQPKSSTLHVYNQGRDIDSYRSRSVSLNKQLCSIKTRYLGYDKTHPDIELLRLRNFTLGCKLDDSEILNGPGFMTEVARLFSVIHPFITCLNRIVLPDPSDDEEESTEEGEGAEDQDEQSAS